MVNLAHLERLVARETYKISVLRGNPPLFREDIASRLCKDGYTVESRQGPDLQGVSSSFDLARFGNWMDREAQEMRRRADWAVATVLAKEPNLVLFDYESNKQVGVLYTAAGERIMRKKLPIKIGGLLEPNYDLLCDTITIGRVVRLYFHELGNINQRLPETIKIVRATRYHPRELGDIDQQLSLNHETALAWTARSTFAEVENILTRYSHRTSDTVEMGKYQTRLGQAYYTMKRLAINAAGSPIAPVLEELATRLHGVYHILYNSPPQIPSPDAPVVERQVEPPRMGIQYPIRIN